MTRITVRGLPGLNVVTWNLLTAGDANAPPRPAQPGRYRVTLTAGGRVVETSLRLDRFVRWTR